jgi:Fe-S cluster assembly protein SufD
MREAKARAVLSDAQAKRLALEQSSLLVEARRILIVDGSFVPELSDLERLEPGLTVRSMAASLAAGDPRVVSELGKTVPTADLAVALNTAFMGDGVVIDVAPGVALARPIHLLFVNAGPEPGAVFMRSLVTIGRGARAMLVESHEGSAEFQVNTVLELKIADDAHVDHVKITRAGALHVSSLMAAIGAQVRFNEFLFTIGGDVVRNQLFVRFAGEGTIAGIRGACLLKGTQHADTTLVADHAAPACTSREMFKSVLDGEARGVFQGKIIVRPHAQKTDARMATHALLLSDAAEADNKPELEIHADDVQCGHAPRPRSGLRICCSISRRAAPESEAGAAHQAFVGEAVEGIERGASRHPDAGGAGAQLTART